MNVDKLREFLTDHVGLVREASSDFICICPICGDHPNPRKRGHLYVSKNPGEPWARCFLCNSTKILPKFIKFVTGNPSISETIISKSEINRVRSENKRQDKDVNDYQLPELSETEFPIKVKYLETRTDNKIDVTKLPNIVFDIKKFVEINHIKLSDDDKNWLEFMQTSMVGFLSHCHTRLFLRCCIKNHYMQFKKISLQDMPFGLLDYYCVHTNNKNSNLIVLSEGTFDILGEYAYDSLELKSKAAIYAAGQSFSYNALIKSVCFNEGLYKVDVVILSDRDKNAWNYRKIYDNNSHVLNSMKVFYNNHVGGDFGSFPIRPVEFDLVGSKAIKTLQRRPKARRTNYNKR